uniref:Leucine-rich repeat-containing N-terminal plant-type domain-containing protein n=1 Tax=Oryza punctata TaxID=4537 RepID=A0A0E0MGF7_ORYPU
MAAAWTLLFFLLLRLGGSSTNNMADELALLASPAGIVDVDTLGELWCCAWVLHISPSLGGLSFLRELDLGDNRLAGQIPPELGHLRRLQVLNLSTNSLQGVIPVALGACARLKTLGFGNLSSLSRLDLMANIFGLAPKIISA